MKPLRLCIIGCLSVIAGWFALVGAGTVQQNFHDQCWGVVFYHDVESHSAMDIACTVVYFHPPI